MEASSLFEDLAYSIEIAGHEATLQHYGARMLLDTASLQREYREWFVPEDWQHPFLARAEVSFELDALAEARSQFTPEEMADAFGLMLPPEMEIEPPALIVELVVKFTLDLYNWVLDQPDADRWQSYLSNISAREKLESGLRNLRGEIRRGLQRGADETEWEPRLEVSAESHMVQGYGLLPKTLNIEWVTSVNSDLDDDEFAAELTAIMTLVRAGIEATRAFQDEIQRDYEEVQ